MSDAESGNMMLPRIIDAGEEIVILAEPGVLVYGYNFTKPVVMNDAESVTLCRCNFQHGFRMVSRNEAEQRASQPSNA